jgi:hypothetical protein
VRRAEREALISPGLRPVLDAVASMLALPSGRLHKRSQLLELMPEDGALVTGPVEA